MTIAGESAFPITASEFRALSKVTAEPFVPSTKSLTVLARALPNCQGCDLFVNGTKAVPGHGPASATVVLVGEQPGDNEEKTGLPFVGPAGVLLDRILQTVGIDRSTVYVTNAVKHFRFEQRGKARLHKRPHLRHVTACHPWLAAELRAIRPTAVVLLGATAASSLLGGDFKLTQSRGELLHTEWAEITMATWHPSLALRGRDAETRARITAELASDLRRVAKRLTQFER